MLNKCLLKYRYAELRLVYEYNRVFQLRQPQHSWNRYENLSLTNRTKPKISNLK